MNLTLHTSSATGRDMIISKAKDQGLEVEIDTFNGRVTIYKITFQGSLEQINLFVNSLRYDRNNHDT